MLVNLECDEHARKSLLAFINDKTTNPIVKYKMFIVVFLLSILGMIILLIMHTNRTKNDISNHGFWRHLFEKPDFNELSNDIYNYRYSNTRMSNAYVFKKAVEGFDTKTLPKSEDGKAVASDGSFASADVQGAKQEKAAKKPTPCKGGDCGEYVDLQGKINVLGKMVDEVKDQKEEIKKVSDGIQAIGVQIKNLSKSLAPNGKLKIKL
jgi:hypothetical protein